MKAPAMNSSSELSWNAGRASGGAMYGDASAASVSVARPALSDPHFDVMKTAEKSMMNGVRASIGHESRVAAMAIAAEASAIANARTSAAVIGRSFLTGGETPIQLLTSFSALIVKRCR